MQSRSKSLIIIVAAVLVAAFFMPWIKFFVGFSAWDIIFGDIGNLIESDLKYVGVLIPVSGALIIYGAAFNNETYALPKKLLFALPILSFIIFSIAIGSKISGGEWIDEVTLNDITKIIGIGFWLSLIASIILPNLNSTSSQAGSSSASQQQNDISSNKTIIRKEQPSDPITTEET